MILIFFYREPILRHAGRFMAPQGDYIADVAILEGNDFIDRNLVLTGKNLLLSGKVKRLVVVLFRIAPSHRPFALNEDYPTMVKKEMEALGLFQNRCHPHSFSLNFSLGKRGDGKHL